MSKEGSHSPAHQVRSWLVTALVVFATLNILLAVLRPFLPYIVVGIVLVTLASWVFGRGGH